MRTLTISRASPPSRLIRHEAIARCTSMFIDALTDTHSRCSIHSRIIQSSRNNATRTIKCVNATRYDRYRYDEYRATHSIARSNRLIDALKRSPDRYIRHSLFAICIHAFRPTWKLERSYATIGTRDGHDPLHEYHRTSGIICFD